MYKLSLEVSKQTYRKKRRGWYHCK